MNADDFVDSAALVEAAGIANAKTLSRWANHGLIPHPVRGKKEMGSGSIGKWPKWTLERCVRIRQMRSQGRSLTEIADHLGCDWELEAEQYANAIEARQVAKPGPGRLANTIITRGRLAALQNLRDTVWKQTATRFCGAHPDRKHWADLIGIELIEAAIGLVRDGIRPVLVLDDEGLSLTADFAISECLHRRGRVSELVLVVPIADDLTEWLSESEQIEPERWFGPIPEVSSSPGRKPVRKRLIVADDWTFNIGRTQ